MKTLPVVTACDVSYFLYTKVFITSLIQRGGVKESSIHLVCLGDSDENQRIKKEIKLHFPRLQTASFDYENSEFEFLMPSIVKNNVATIADYARAWMGKSLERYLWMDSDMLVRKNLLLTLQSLERDHKLAMCFGSAPLQASQSDSRYLIALIYSSMYEAVHGVLPRIHFDSSGLPRTFNCGFLYVDRDYSREWLRIYEKLLPRFQRRCERTGWPMHLFGEGIWNLLFWKNGGNVLHDAVNHLPPPEGRADVAPLVSHYPGHHKMMFFADSIGI